MLKEEKSLIQNNIMYALKERVNIGKRSWVKVGGYPSCYIWNCIICWVLID